MLVESGAITADGMDDIGYHQTYEMLVGTSQSSSPVPLCLAISKTILRANERCLRKVYRASVASVVTYIRFSVSRARYSHHLTRSLIVNAAGGTEQIGPLLSKVYILSRRACIPSAKSRESVISIEQAPHLPAVLCSLTS